MSGTALLRKIFGKLFLGLVFSVSFFTSYQVVKLEPEKLKAVGESFAGLGADLLVGLGGKVRDAMPESAQEQQVAAFAEAMEKEQTYANFRAPWPKAARPERNPRHAIIKEDVERGFFVYESPGYRFYSDIPIEYNASAHFATVFETTKAFLKSLPLGLLRADEVTGKSKVLLFGTDAGYAKAGGPPGSAGCYFPAKRLVLVPVSSLGLRKTEKGMERDQTDNYKTLIHELTHQLTPTVYYAHGSNGWFTEGLAEYAGATPYRPGYFWVDRFGTSIKAYVTAYGNDERHGRALGTDISVPPLEKFMLMPYSDFSGKNANRNYGVALLMAYYFFHLEGGGGAERITAFLEGLREGKYGEEALQVLHGGEGFRKLEQDITAAWSKVGVTIRFTAAD